VRGYRVGMESRGAITSEERGTHRLLAHLDAFERMTAEDGGRGRARLEAEVGPEAARLLLRGLTRRPDGRRLDVPPALSA